ncbi:hypothetical protein [Aeromonas popoffii]|uniref:Uncharacterized protein n=1 Tax=Aeromonas popoffii TaxID=70856 RepID=A0ABS5GUW2_9GAMM|nr:hypothetical protein [Aeromonas popoffii]MBR7630931.1 hypothetical protein [Aeromonas popoffii]
MSNMFALDAESANAIKKNLIEQKEQVTNKTIKKKPQTGWIDCLSAA